MMCRRSINVCLSHGNRRWFHLAGIHREKEDFSRDFGLTTKIEGIQGEGRRVPTKRRRTETNCQFEIETEKQWWRREGELPFRVIGPRLILFILYKKYVLSSRLGAARARCAGDHPRWPGRLEERIKKRLPTALKAAWNEGKEKLYNQKAKALVLSSVLLGI